MNGLETLIIVVLIFGLLVSIHEFGHLVVAKKSGILCREFAIGFGPKLFAWKRNETVYTLRLLPIGGYVRMAGEDPEILEIKAGQTVGLYFGDGGKVKRITVDHAEKYPDARFITVEKCDLEKSLYISGYEEEDGPLKVYNLDRQATYVTDYQDYQIAPLDRQFASQSLPKRFLTIFAGPFMNLVLAVVVFIIFYGIQGVPSDAPQMGQLLNGYPAKEAGLQAGDRVVSINGRKISSWNQMVSYIQKHPKQKLTFTINRGGKVRNLDLVTDQRKATSGKAEGVIGVYQPTRRSLADSLAAGVKQTGYWIGMELKGLEGMVTGKFSLDDLAGPARMYDITGQVVAQGLVFVLNWTAFLSVNLAVINLLPLPALDGGRLLFLIIEAIRGKPVEPQKEALVHFIGFAFLMLLMLLVTWNDLQMIFTR